MNHAKALTSSPMDAHVASCRVGFPVHAMRPMSCPPACRTTVCCRCCCCDGAAIIYQVYAKILNKMGSGGKRRGLPEEMRRNKNKLSRTGTCLPRKPASRTKTRTCAAAAVAAAGTCCARVRLHSPSSKSAAVEVSNGPTPLLFSPALKDGGCGGSGALPE